MWRLVRPPAGTPRIEGGKLEVAQEEPLKRELEDFVDAVREGRRRGSPAKMAAARWRWPNAITERDGLGQR